MQVVAPHWSGWSLSLYPDAGEAGGAPASSRPREWSPSPPGEAADPERSAVEAARRARGKVRRYCAANRLNRLGTLTYRSAGCHDQRAHREHLAEFFRALRVQRGGRRFAYLWVPEWHKSGHGLHAHFAVGQFIPRRQIEAAWPHGFVHIKLLGDLPVGSTDLDEARKAAGYLAKYVGKDLAVGQDRLPGLHRYEVGQGFQPQRITIEGPTVDIVLELAARRMRRQPAKVVYSAEVADYEGHPWVWATWN